MKTLFLFWAMTALNRSLANQKLRVLSTILSVLKKIWENSSTFSTFNLYIVYLIFSLGTKLHGRYIFFGLRTYYIKPTKKEYFSPCLISVSNFCCRDLRQFGQKSNCFESKDLPLLPLHCT